MSAAKSDLETMARTVAAIAEPGMNPKDLFAAVRQRHPKASKKQVSRAAFYAAIIAAETAPDAVPVVHDLALGARTTDSESGTSEADYKPTHRRKRSKQFPSYRQSGT